ncbi:MAG: FmdB family zinc ribbon protein, partial [Ilumatobacteraceae bacterium]
MPTYVYKFIETGETIEVQQSFNDDALTEAVHPGTGETMPVKKVFQPVGVTFKGGGFYKTDSRGGSSSSSSTSNSTST